MIDVANDLREIEECIKDVLEESKIKECKLKLESKSGGGFVSGIVFIHLFDVEDPTHGLKLALKYLGTHATPKLHAACTVLFQREVFIYTEVMPILRQFQQGKHIEPTFNSIPRCYGLATTKTDQILILDNMLSQGYSVWPKQQPLTFAHTELLLKQFAKWHSLSFALKDQNPEKYEFIAENKEDFHGNVCRKSRFYDFVRDSFRRAVKLIEVYLNEKELTELKNLNENFDELYFKLGLDETDFTVLCHGDCWNNNFMFKHQDTAVNEEKKVTDLCILDWQCATISTPVYDLSHILYITTGREQLDKMAELLHMYYENFSNSLRQLGSDPETLYPLEKFKEQWNRYSLHGVLHAPGNIKHCMAKNPRAMEFLNTDSGPDTDYDFEVTDLEQYKLRVIDLVKQYVRFKFE